MIMRWWNLQREFLSWKMLLLLLSFEFHQITALDMCEFCLSVMAPEHDPLFNIVANYNQIVSGR